MSKFYVLLNVHLDIIVQRKSKLMHNLFLVYIVNIYMFRVCLGPSSGGKTVCIQQLVLITLFRWLSVVLVGLDNSHLKRIISTNCCIHTVVELVRNLVAHSNAREGKWRGNWRMEWVASTLTPPPNVVYPALLQADAHTSAASSRLNWRSHRFKWTRPFRGKTKSGFCACAIRFRTSSTALSSR